VRWTVIIPAKALPEAKSRLLGATADPAEHRALVLALRADTVAAVARTDAVARYVLVVDRPIELPAPTGVDVVVQSRPGLNEALREAAEHAARTWPDDAIAALVGDLPALRTEELAVALAAAAAHDRAFVPDAAGLGTTLLTAAPGRELRPRFGPGSAERHRADAVELPAGPGLRHDVDTADDLAAAARLAVGPATEAVLAAYGVALRSR
jgi:2-phospho-L-lactate guanylyltransferase